MKRSVQLCRRESKFVVSLLFVLGSWLIAAPVAVAQTTAVSQIIGVVNDPSGAAVPGAKVTATDPTRGLSFVTTTETDGFYRLQGVPPGTYRLEVEAKGFQTYIAESVIVYLRQDRRVDVGLTVGAVTERVTVQAVGSVIATETATVAVNVAERELRDYPTQGRGNTSGSPIYRMMTVPGFSPDNWSMNGSSASDFRSEVDGNDAHNYGTYRPSEEQLQEVRTFTVNAPAEFQAMGTAQGTSRSGTNSFHGLVRMDVRNTALNALGPNPTTRPPGKPSLTQDYSIGGPIWKDHTFFQFSYRLINRRASSYMGGGYVFPQPQMREGDLSLISTPIIDPTTGEPFPGNIIPQDRFDPASAKLLSYFPLPNRGSSTDLVDNYGRFADDNWDSRNINFRIDQQITPANRMFFNYSRVADIYLGDYGPIPGMYVFDGDYPSRLFTVHDTHVFSPTLLHEFMFGITYSDVHYFYGQYDGAEILRSLGINTGGRPIPSGIGFPNVSITGMTGIGNPNGTVDIQQSRQYTVRDSFSITRGKHLIQTGVQVRHHRPSSLVQFTGTWGNYNFDGSVTGNAFADFLLGIPQSTSISRPRSLLEQRFNELGIYFQDSWRATPRLTLNLGFRNQMYTVPYDANGLQYNFDLHTMRVVVPGQIALDNVPAGYPLQVVTAAEAGYPSHLLSREMWMPEPRLGLAYKLTNDDKTVLRLGYGLFHQMPHPFGSFMDIWAEGPFTLSESFGPNQIVDGVPQLTFSNPFPTGPGEVGLPTVYSLAPKFKRAYFQQWSSTFERQLGAGIGIGITYTGTKGTHIAYQQDINRPPASLNPYQRVYPNYSAINVVDFGGNSIYHSIQILAHRQFSSGLYFRASYENMRQTSDIGLGYPNFTYGAAIEDPYDRRAGRGTVGDYIEPEKFMFTSVYPLPIGKGQLLLDRGGLLNHVLGNWTISGYLKISGGTIFTPYYSGADPSNTNLYYGRADYVSGCDIGGKRNEWFWFNPACFVVPEAGRFGNVRPGMLRGPNFYKTSLNIYKDIKLGEWWRGFEPKLKIEMNADNFLNHPYQQYLDMIVGLPSFGYAFKFDQRTIQLNGSFSF